MAPPLVVAFAGGTRGAWRVERIDAVRGESLKTVERLAVHESAGAVAGEGAAWLLRGFNSNLRYSTREEHATLLAAQPGLGRPEATKAALIPIRKSERWWNMAQDERRGIFEGRSRHTETGLKYLPAVARRLLHGRDLGEPFDFLTWFEYAPADAAGFEELVRQLRATEEWEYVEREVDIRLAR